MHKLQHPSPAQTHAIYCDSVPERSRAPWRIRYTPTRAPRQIRDNPDLWRRNIPQPPLERMPLYDHPSESDQNKQTPPGADGHGVVIIKLEGNIASKNTREMTL